MINRETITAAHADGPAQSPEQHQEKVRGLKRKMKVLKEAVKQERQANQELQDSLYRANDALKRKEADSSRRDEKNETLLLEIRVLRDAFIAEKNEREELESKLEELSGGKTQTSQGLLSGSNYFGLRSFFQR